MPTFRASIVEYCAEHDGYRCGYCKSADGNYSRGIWAHCLDPRDYQNLIDRGWRRSGKYCYKPTMSVTCCPLYTIRCEALNFKLSKSQKKVLKKVNNYLIHGKKPNSNTNDRDTPVRDNHDIYDICDMPSEVFQKYSSKAEPTLDLTSEVDSASSKEATNCDQQPSESSTSAGSDLSSQMDTSSSATTSGTPKKGLGADPSRPVCRKAKEIRLENKRQKLMKRAIQGEITSEQMDQLLFHKEKCPKESKSLEDFLKEAEVENAAHRLRVKLVRSDLNDMEFKTTFHLEHHVYQHYQTTIHKDSPDKCSEKQFTRFLVKGPFKEHQPGGPLCGYGIFHQQYWLDDMLIAVGVIDILPNCVSSVYLFYDPEYSFLSLGIYSAIREIAFTREIHKQSASLQYYYMGYYIHSCPKMRYKAQFSPSNLLCPESYSWVPYEKCVPKFQASKYARLEDDPSKVDEDSQVDLSRVWILHNQKPKRYPAYIKASSNDDRDEVTMYASLVGKKCYSRMLLFRN